jgi:LCP family protein required for cell wall assembly
MYEGLRNLEVPRHPHPRARRFFKTLLVLGLCGAVAFGGASYIVYTKVKGNLDKGKDPNITELTTKLPGGALNFLVLGSDRRDVIEGGDRSSREFRGGDGQRADVIILVHIAPKAESAVMVSLPRDLRVRIPGKGTNKINAAYAGGPDLMLETVADFTGLPIHHYVEVNFASFQQIVDAVGGVKIYVNRALKDKKAGLNLPSAGCYHMNGRTALSFVRARNIDPTADIGRIQRQQLFIRTLLGKVKSTGFLLNFGRVLKLSEAVGEGLKYDSGVDLGLARAVANKLAGYERVDFRIVPGAPRTVGGVSYVVPDEAESQALFAAIGADEPLPDFGKTQQSLPKPADVSVKVLNGSGKSGLATVEKERLSDLGYRAHVGGNGKATDVTIISHVFGADLKAQLLQKQYKGAIIEVGPRSQVSDIEVTLGADAAAAAEARANPSASPKPKASTTAKTRSASAACR